jgi:pyruvate/2-oxoglutarate/acetoin dehydrogenase E1 component
VGNQTNRASEHEQTVENSHLEVILGLLVAEGARVSKKIDEADGDTAVDVENEVVLLRGCDRFDGECVIEELGVREVGLAVLLYERNTEIGVVARLDTVTNTRNCTLLAFDDSLPRENSY